MQQPPNPYPQQGQQPQFFTPQLQPPSQQPAPKKKSRKKFFAIGCGAVAVLLVLIIVIAAVAASSAGSSNNPNTTSQAAQPAQATQAHATPTAAPTRAPTQAPTAAPTQKLAPLPSVSDLNKIVDQHDGTVTSINVTKEAYGTGLGIDIQVYNPTQTRVKHLAYELAQYFYGFRPDVTLINLAFHANGYTGMDDPIATCAGPAPSQWAGMDESQLWDAMGGLFDANLPA